MYGQWNHKQIHKSSNLTKNMSNKRWNSNKRKAAERTMQIRQQKLLRNYEVFFIVLCQSTWLRYEVTQ